MTDQQQPAARRVGLITGHLDRALLAAARELGEPTAQHGARPEPAAAIAILRELNEATLRELRAEIPRARAAGPATPGTRSAGCSAATSSAAGTSAPWTTSATWPSVSPPRTTTGSPRMASSRTARPAASTCTTTTPTTSSRATSAAAPAWPPRPRPGAPRRGRPPVAQTAETVAVGPPASAREAYVRATTTVTGRTRVPAVELIVTGLLTWPD